MNATKPNTESISVKKKIQENVFLLNWNAHAKTRALLKEKKFYPKKSLTFLLHQAIQLFFSVLISWEQYDSQWWIRVGYTNDYWWPKKVWEESTDRPTCRNTITLFMRDMQDGNYNVLYCILTLWNSLRGFFSATVHVNGLFTLCKLWHFFLSAFTPLAISN